MSASGDENRLELAEEVSLIASVHGGNIYMSMDWQEIRLPFDAAVALREFLDMAIAMTRPVDEHEHIN